MLDSTTMLNYYKTVIISKLLYKFALRSIWGETVIPKRGDQGEGE